MKKILHAQADKGNFEEMKRLIDQHINSKDEDQQTLLHKASIQGDLMGVQYLIKVGAQVNAIDEHGRTPLHFARTSEIATLLIQNGAQIDAKDRNGWTQL